jgi:hypothetical protein
MYIVGYSGELFWMGSADFRLQDFNAPKMVVIESVWGLRHLLSRELLEGEADQQDWFSQERKSVWYFS